MGNWQAVPDRMNSPIRATNVKADFQASRKSKIIENIAVYPIDKAVNRQRFDVSIWRSGLAKAALTALDNDSTVPYRPEGPFSLEQL